MRVAGFIMGSGDLEAVLLCSSNMKSFVQYWLKRFSWAATWSPLRGRGRLLLSERERGSSWRLSSCKGGQAEGHLVEAETVGRGRRNSARPCSSDGNGPSLLPLRKVIQKGDIQKEEQLEKAARLVSTSIFILSHLVVLSELYLK